VTVVRTCDREGVGYSVSKASFKDARSGRVQVRTSTTGTASSTAELSSQAAAASRSKSTSAGVAAGGAGSPTASGLKQRSRRYLVGTVLADARHQGRARRAHRSVSGQQTDVRACARHASLRETRHGSADALRLKGPEFSLWKLAASTSCSDNDADRRIPDDGRHVIEEPDAGGPSV
jgi:hypothetical protein